MPIAFGNDYTLSTTSTSNTRTDALTFGSTGSNALLFVLIEAADNNWSTPITVEYGGIAMTSVGGKLGYAGAGTTTYKELYYINNNLASGQNLFINSNATTGLGENGAKSWIYRYWTYGGVGSIGTTKINTTDFTTSASGSPVSVSFNFTPSSAASTIVQLLPGNSISTTTTTYGSTTGTMRQDITPTTYGSSSGWLAFSDYTPGSTATYSVSQSFNPNFTSATGYGWAMELIPPGSRNTQAVFI